MIGDDVHSDMIAEICGIRTYLVRKPHSDSRNQLDLTSTSNKKNNQIQFFGTFVDLYQES